MILNIKEFTGALAKITALTTGDKTVPGVLLDIKDNTVDVCYSDGRKAFIETIGAVVGEEDRKEKIVLNYQRLVDIMGICKSSGRIHTDDIEIIFDSDKLLRIKVEKKVAEYQNEEEEPVYKTISVVEQTMAWEKADSGMKVAILTRIDYNKIFEGEEIDTWSIDEFKRVLSKVSNEKNKIAYVSPKKASAFVANMTYMTSIPLNNPIVNPIVLSTATSKSLVDILSKMNDDSVNVYLIDKKYCCIYNESKTVGIWLEMAASVGVHINTLGEYESKDYTKYQLTFIKEVLMNVIESAMSADKTDKTVLKFADSKLEVGAKELKIASKNSMASISNEYSVLCTECIDKENNINALELPIGLKVLHDMLSKCDSDFVGIDIDINDNNVRCVRVSEIDFEKRADVMSQVRNTLMLDESSEIPDEEKLNHRKDIIVGKHYTISAM